ncbi:carboxymuconolactone decarboxylase family protein [Roseisalinus antarcticus]|uniref:Carboxymuconolactone decarboxylase family protein n=1 Tax=Roseisalinus antarcticus TaxID=254357 RepID=A0A1Y5TS32_9RHOB|nr:carboxymuconolactone decarboxylase family protein [Roseisalinus antarcticus]SLN70862.1 Carboxymuconolactone decarboxylase family protein [Roseisalinus antarcticus]
MLIGARPGEMTSQQQALHDAIASGPRGGVPLPFLAMLDSPGLCDAIQGVGETIRYRTTMTDRQREIAILAAAAACGSGYEWGYHDALAVKAGMTPAERTAVLDGSGAGLRPGEGAMVRYIRIAVHERRADAAELADITATLGREIATEATAIAGYYPLLALFLGAGGLDEPLPASIA